MHYYLLQSWERRLLALYDCECVMAPPSIVAFLDLVRAKLATSDTLEVGGVLMNIYHITPKGDEEARRMKRRMK